MSWLELKALSGEPMVQRQRFLPDQANVQSDWPVDESQRDALLQPGEGYTTQSRFDALGQMVEQCNAAGHRQHLGIDRAGQLQRIDLTLSSGTTLSILSTAHYDAQGQLLSQTTGNDVTASAAYEACTGRLQRLTATTAQGVRLQDLEYQYDPVGNVELCLDHTQVTTFFANQRVGALHLFVDGDDASLAVVLRAPVSAATVPVFGDLPCCVRQQQAPAAIDAVGEQCGA